MIPQVSIEVIANIAQKLAEMSEQSYKIKNLAPLQKEMEKIQDKQPFLLNWFAVYCQACSQQGMRTQEIVVMQIVLIAILKSLYAQSEVSELERLFGGEGIK